MTLLFQSGDAILKAHLKLQDITLPKKEEKEESSIRSKISAKSSASLYQGLTKYRSNLEDKDYYFDLFDRSGLFLDFFQNNSSYLKIRFYLLRCTDLSA